MKLSGHWRRLRGAAGSEIAEAALILPLLFMLLLSIYWFGRAFSIYSTINHAARQAVLTAASSSCANCGAGGWAGSGFADDGTVGAVVDQALMAANLDPTQAQASMPNPVPAACLNVQPEGLCATAASKAGAKLTICRNVVLDQNSTSPQACGMIVSFQYPYQFVLPFTSLNKQLINLRAEAEIGGEN